MNLDEIICHQMVKVNAWCAGHNCLGALNGRGLVAWYKGIMAIQDVVAGLVVEHWGCRGRRFKSYRPDQFLHKFNKL